MPKPSPLVLWLLLTLNVAALAFFALGWAMTGSFTVSNPRQGFDRGVAVYTLLLGVALAGSLWCVIALVRLRSRGER